MAELQKDPVTRGQFLLMGTLGTLVGAALTIPPIVYLLNPTIKVNILGESDVADDWEELGSVFEIPSGEPKVYRVEFPQNQTYNGRGDLLGEGVVYNAVLVSWRDGDIPAILQNREAASFSEAEIEELTGRLNVMSNHCAHLGCPVRWIPEKGEILCPCHGGIYTINGTLIGGPPPRGLFGYLFEIREDGTIYIKHDFVDGKPYVV